MKNVLILILLLGFAKVNAQELILDIREGYESSGPGNFCSNNGLLFFTAMDGNVYGECELWKTDGTVEGTVMIKDINPTAGAIRANNSLVAMNGFVYFPANDGVHGLELWKSDGSAAGTVLVKDIQAGPAGYGIWNLCVMNNVLYFSADDAVHGRELWKSNGTTAGTVMVKDVLPGEYNGFFDTQSEFGILDDFLYFNARDATNITSQLWKTNGTEQGTTKVSNILVEKNKKLKAFNGKIYFSGCENCELTGEELCVSDGTESGTKLLKDVNTSFSGKGRSAPTMLIEYDGNLFFTATDNVYGNELWKTDGTEAGTKLLKDIYSGSGSSFPNNLKVYNNSVYFFAYSNEGRTLFWKTDGTEEGTKALTTSATSFSSSLAVFKNKLYLGASDGIVGTELWESDGTSAGTRLLKDIQPAGITVGASSYPEGFYNHDNKMLYFLADNGRTGKELWRLDGTNLKVASFETAKISIFPNPSSSILNVQLINNEEVNKITITDLSGRKVKEEKGNHTKINIENLPSGIYIMDVYTGNSKVSNKFIKK